MISNLWQPGQRRDPFDLLFLSTNQY